MGFAQGGDFLKRNAIDESPEVCRAGRKPLLVPYHLLDLVLGEGLPQPGDCRTVTQFQNPENGVLRILYGIESFKVNIPK
ncbi:MAG: hypothetical protein DMG13_07065 [Acidobacteria bacterium]|nr:MAG: hypothetical protein DMG13_07065 [Acidobacteriota bacterium]